MYADIKAEIVYENLDDTITTLKHSTKRLLEFCGELKQKLIINPLDLKRL
jgi:hypothetical protein